MTAAHRRALRERTAEISSLTALIGAVPQGGRLVLVEGPHGIGKTRLLEAARDLALEAGHDVDRPTWTDAYYATARSDP